jgi:hypothetical protein
MGATLNADVREIIEELDAVGGGFLPDENG